MKVGEVIRKERERKRLDSEKVANQLGLSVDEYQALEAGGTPVEEWGPKLAQIAIKLSTPTSRLISETGKSSGAKLTNGQCGQLIAKHREQRNLSQEQLGSLLSWPADEVVAIEKGESPLETYAPLLLRFAEVIDQPIFNLFYPCGLPVDKLQDYP